MARTISIPLSEPITTHGAPISTVILREPTASDFWEIGRVKRYGHTPDGTIFTVENDAAYKAYIERCVVEPKDATHLEQIQSLADGLKIRKAIDDFFEDALRTI